VLALAETGTKVQGRIPRHWAVRRGAPRPAGPPTIRPPPDRPSGPLGPQAAGLRPAGPPTIRPPPDRPSGPLGPQAAGLQIRDVKKRKEPAGPYGHPLAARAPRRAERCTALGRAWASASPYFGPPPPP
jgi:hypothetical protein